MSSLKSFEKQLKSDADRQVDNSASFLWDDISKAINTKPKRRKRYILLFLLLLMAGAAFTTWYVSDDSGSGYIKSVTNTLTKNEVITRNNGNETPKNEFFEPTKLADKKPNENFPEKLEKEENEAYTAIQDNGVIDKKYSGHSENKSFPTIFSKRNFLKSTGLAKEEPKPVQTNISNTFSNQVSDIDGEKVETNDTAPHLTSLNNNHSLNTNFENSKQLDNHFIKPLNAPNLLLSDMKLSENIFETGPKCPSFSKKKINYFIETGIEAGIPIKKLGTSADAPKLYDLRKETENPWYSWGLSLKGGILVKERFSISTGVEYLQLNERFDYTKSEVVDLIYHVNPNTGVVTGPYPIFKNISSSGQIRHKLVNIPLTVGYKLLDKDFELQLDAGVYLNVHSKSTGKIMVASDSIGSIENLNMYKGSLGMGLSGGFTVGKKIGGRSLLFLRPTFRYSLNEWNRESYQMNTLYHNFSVSAGWRIRI